MSKYAPLGHYLRLKGTDRVTLSFDDVADIIGDALPPSAFEHAEWWANSPSHVEALAWLDAGWKTQSVSPLERCVTFVRE